MSDRVFVDTSVLLYAYDGASGPKQKVAQEILIELWGAESGRVSMQVLQEFYNGATRKLKMPVERARAIAERFVLWCVPTGPAEIRRAFQIEDETKMIRFWDALIVAAAAKAGADRLLTEDLNHGQSIAGIRVENPFRS